jgi:hypothetical protein
MYEDIQQLLVFSGLKLDAYMHSSRKATIQLPIKVVKGQDSQYLTDYRRKWIYRAPIG